MVEHQPQQGDQAAKPSPMADKHLAEGAVIGDKDTQSIFNKASFGALSTAEINRILPSVEIVGSGHTGKAATNKPAENSSSPEQKPTRAYDPADVKYPIYDSYRGMNIVGYEHREPPVPSKHEEMLAEASKDASQHEKTLAAAREEMKSPTYSDKLFPKTDISQFRFDKNNKPAEVIQPREASKDKLDK